MEKRTCQGTPMRAEVKLYGLHLRANGSVPGCGAELIEVQYRKAASAGILAQATLHVCPRCDSPDVGLVLPEGWGDD